MCHVAHSSQIRILPATSVAKPASRSPLFALLSSRFSLRPYRTTTAHFAVTFAVTVISPGSIGVGAMAFAIAN